MIRIFFCAAPASIFGGAAAYFHPLLGLIVFLVVADVMRFASKRWRL